jgi:hypothetical protein
VAGVTVNLRRGGVGAIAITAAILLWRLRPGSVAHADGPIREPQAVARLATWAPAPPASRAGRVMGYLWAGPLTVAGLLIGVLSRTRPQVRDGVLLFSEARGVGGRMLRWRGFAAATLGHTIITAREPSTRLLRHELVHVRQAERWGPLFVPLYLAGLLRYGYRRNPFERAAYDAAADGPTPA